MSDERGVPAVVTLHVWGVRPASVPGALLAMTTDRRSLAGVPGLRFAKLLGTGRGRTFTVTDADPRHWALLASWQTTTAARAFAGSPLVRRWRARADEELVLALDPLASRGRWSGRQPFGDPSPASVPPVGPVAAITRARVRPSWWRRFNAAVPPVSARLAAAPGLLLSLGVGEAPVGLQGTVSVWRDDAALRDFAHGSAEHRAVVVATRDTGWYAEELFARFAVRSGRGSLGGIELTVGTDPLA